MTDGTRHDPLLDAPDWAPSWLPDAGDARGVRILRHLISVVFVAGLGACIAEGANSPADPVLGEPVASLPGELAGALTEVLGKVVSITGEITELCLLVADEPAERARGLTGVTDLEGYDGMVFAHTGDVQSSFHMRQVPTPLDLAWFDGDGAFIGAINMEPCMTADTSSCVTYPPPAPFRFAIEVFTGSPEAAAFADADRLALGGSCHPRSA